MTRDQHNSAMTFRGTEVLFASGAAMLAATPIRWLVHTWTDPAFDSPGPWVLAVVTALLLWSVTSRRLGLEPGVERRGQRLLFVTAGVRLVSRLLDIDVLGGMALVVDVYALALLLGVDRRARALSPGWLAALFTFCLPIERILQRVVGYVLQWIAARAACGVLGLGFPAVHCAGVDVQLAGRHVLVDLPCSGARGLVTLGLLFATVATVVRPGLLQAATGAATAMGAAIGANVLRIVLLVLGVAFPEAVAGGDVMAAPWHEAIGALAVLLGATPTIPWARRVPIRQQTTDGQTTDLAPPTSTSAYVCCLPSPSLLSVIPHVLRRQLPPHVGCSASSGHHLAAAIVFVTLAFLALVLPHRPFDASGPVEPVELPATLLGYVRHTDSLTEKERTYFARYGGRAVKATYGPYGVLAVTTTAPLRHLHAPDECLRGAGHVVRLLGTVYEGRLPSALYRSVAPDGAAFRIAATFISNRGRLATSVSEAVWAWMGEPATVWTELQRIAPLETSAAQTAAFDAALAAALELPPNGAAAP